MNREASGELARALLRVHFVHFAGVVVVEASISQPWASATFSGARHLLTLCLDGPGARAAAAAFLAGIEEREFALKGHILADIAAVDLREDGENLVRLTLEALTVEAD